MTMRANTPPMVPPMTAGSLICFVVWVEFTRPRVGFADTAIAGVDIAVEDVGTDKIVFMIVTWYGATEFIAAAAVLFLESCAGPT